MKPGILLCDCCGRGGDVSDTIVKGVYTVLCLKCRRRLEEVKAALARGEHPDADAGLTRPASGLQ